MSFERIQRRTKIRTVFAILLPICYFSKVASKSEKNRSTFIHLLLCSFLLEKSFNIDFPKISFRFYGTEALMSLIFLILKQYYSYFFNYFFKIL